MQRVISIILMIGLMAAWPVFAQVEGESPDSFRIDESSEAYMAAKLVPADVGGFICIANAEKALDALLKSDVGNGLRAFYDRSNGGEAWRNLSEELKLPSDDLFRILLGRRLILVTDFDPAAAEEPGGDRGGVNGEGDEAPVLRWVAMSNTSPDDFKHLLWMLKYRVIRYINKVPVYAARGKSELEISYRDNLLLLGTQANRELFDQIVGGDIKESLADQTDFLETLKLDPGQVTAFFREPFEQPADQRHGWNGMTIRVSPHGTTINIRSDASATSPKIVFSDIRKFRSPIDLAMLESVNEGALSVIVEHFEPHPRSSLGFMELLSPFLQQYPDVATFTGPTMFSVIDSRAADQLPLSGGKADEIAGINKALNPDARKLTITLGVELKKPWTTAARRMDELLVGSLKALQVCVDQPELLKIPNIKQPIEPGRVQLVDLTPCSKDWIGFVPGIDDMVLHWTMVRNESHAWWVCSTDLDALQKTTKSLVQREPLPAENDEVAMGAIDGPAAASLLESWKEVNARTKHPVFSRLFYAQEILRATPRIHWVVRQNEELKTTDTTITVDWGF
jgi:hypothetical protein